MKNLLYKELRLALHPTAILFLFLSAMLLIPGYPYYVVFFYTCLGIFFICLNGRESRDIYYMMLLPIRKRQIVQARFLLAVLLELVQLLLATPFAFLRQTLIPGGNPVGMDANIALFGLSFLLLGAFNYCFFTSYYRNPDKVGISFLLGSAALAVLMIVAEAATYVVPLFRDRLDTPDPQFLPEKLATLALGLLVYALLTLLAYRKSIRSFQALDLSI